MSPKEIAEYILKDGIITTNAEDVYSLANAYSELEKKNLSLTQAVENYHAQLNRWDRERIDAGYEQIIFELKEENEKLKKSREVLRKALAIAVDALKDIEEHYEHPNDLQNINSARLRGCQLEAKNALEKISEIMEEK